MITTVCAGLIAIVAPVIAGDVIRAGQPITFANTTTEAGLEVAADAEVIGREARRTIYAGQPITLENTRPLRLVSRNQIVTIKFVSGPLEISTVGRAMGEAGLNDTVSVMNLDSRELITGIVQQNGWVLVQ